MITLKRYKSNKKLQLTARSMLGSGQVMLTFREATQLIDDLTEMVEGKLIQVKEQECGCLTRIYEKGKKTK